ncbi:hypothetical protein JYB88_01445 [Shewanella cyperi]|uniref:Uncharacterized protein n=1 Tax=Shewanella cyperi TaxID=2814292 RepID=A0A974XN72_9GAMM|nr:hypothetical protein [Shewanella cyperi]QSX30358.1 hypothetical protein JYB88_01445 [Shewanella cyperi]
MFSLFKTQKSISIDGLGEFSLQEREWVGKLTLNEVGIELCLDGDKHSPDPFAVAYALEHKSKFDAFWKAAINFAQSRLIASKAPFAVSDPQFVLNMVSVHKQHTFDGGHLSFWFNIESDPEGSYYVSFLNEVPDYLHRDS